MTGDEKVKNETQETSINKGDHRCRANPVERRMFFSYSGCTLWVSCGSKLTVKQCKSGAP